MTPPPADAAAHVAAPVPSAGESVLHRVGTLAYDRRGVTRLFVWLLWGDFAFNFFESVFSRFMPLYLKDLHASNTLIGVMTGSIAGIVNVAFLPHISQWSDRLRSRLGRRIPFLLAVTPLTVGALVLVGFAPEIGHALFGLLPAKFFQDLGLTADGLALGLLCVFVVLYHFFNMVLVNGFAWLLRDVVPQSLMPRFLSWFRIVGTVGTVLFLWYVFPTMIVYRRETCLGVGLFYLASFLFMCRNVREGGYEAPPERAPGVGLLALYRGYFENCLSVPLYRNFLFGHVLFIVGTSCANSFLTLYARNTLGLDMGDIGRTFAYSALAQAAVYVPMAWVCERVAPLRVALVSLVLLVAGSVLAYFFVRGREAWFVYQILIAVPTVGWILGMAVFGMQLFPARDYGQLSSGLNVFGCGGLIVGNFLLGRLMDVTDSRYGLVFLWTALLLGVALAPLIRVHSGWLRHGGPARYVPPQPPGLPL